MGDPLPINQDGDLATCAKGDVNVDFRLCAEQAGGLRDCGDLCRNHLNLPCEVCAPIKLPKLGRISQMRMDVRASGRTWAFFKAGH